VGRGIYLTQPEIDTQVKQTKSDPQSATYKKNSKITIVPNNELRALHALPNSKQL
jgi:hypothetical protein